MIRRKVYAHIERLRDKVYLGMTYHASEPYAWSLGWYDPQDLTYLLGREPANWEVVPCDLVWDGETLTLVKEGVLTVASLEEVSADTMREIAESKFVPEPDPRPF